MKNRGFALVFVYFLLRVLFLCFSMFIVFGLHGFLFCVESSFDDVLIYALHVVLCRAYYRFMSCILLARRRIV